MTYTAEAIEQQIREYAKLHRKPTKAEAERDAYNQLKEAKLI